MGAGSDTRSENECPNPEVESTHAHNETPTPAKTIRNTRGDQCFRVRRCFIAVTRTGVFCLTGFSNLPRLRLLLEGGLASEVLRMLSKSRFSAATVT